MALVVGTNSYIDVTDADTYFTHAIHAGSWTAADTTTKENALVSATRSLDRQTWLGSKYLDAQALDFPRSGLTDSEGDTVDETAVPQEMLDATCEYALALIENTTLANEANTNSNIKSLKAGSAEIAYFRATRGKRFSTTVSELISLWLDSTSAYSGPFVSGADNVTGFSDTFNLNRGL